LLTPIKNEFFLEDCNVIWRSVLHLGSKQVVPKSFTWVDSDAEMFSFLDSGCVRLECLSFSGKQRIVLFMNQGCIFREVTLLPFEFSNTFRLVTTEECVIYNFPRTLLTDNIFVKSHPELITSLTFSLMQKTKILFARLADDNEENIEQTVCFYIDKLADKYENDVSSPMISQSEFAATIGIHRSTLGKILKKLRDENVLGCFIRNRIEILDRKKLKQYASGCTVDSK